MSLADGLMGVFPADSGVRGIGHAIAANFQAERQRWMLWIPVLLGVGIGAYFELHIEPPLWSGALASGALLGGVLLCRRLPALQVAVLALLLVSAGFTAAQFRSFTQEAPVIGKRTGPVAIEGQLIALERLNDGTRLLIAPRTIDRLDRLQAPLRVRLKLTGKTAGNDLRPGDLIRLRGTLMPPPGPVMPGGFDYGRMLWFERIGAVGFTFGPPQRLAAAQAPEFWLNMEIWLAGLRDRLTRRIIAAIPGEAGPVSAALMTGERGAISAAVNQAMRDSGLVHLLSISGLHMGFLAGIVFFAVRGGLALIEPVALRYPIKKWAALAAITGTLLYLFISGASIPTQRSFIMTGAVLLAVMLDRIGISMRLIAIAAALILLISPESLHHASFQLSFAAVIALVAMYEWMSAHQAPRLWNAGLIARGLRYVGGLALTSLLAGLATAPLIAFHFNRIGMYSLLANLLAVPLTGAWIMPCAVAAFALMPFGLERWALAPMGVGVEWVIAIANAVAALPGSAAMVAQPPVIALLLVIAGFLWVCLWSLAWRWAGLVFVALGLLLAPFGSRPDILVDTEGRLIAVRGPDGSMRVNSMRVAKHARNEWAKAEGSAAPLPAAANSAHAACDGLGCMFTARDGRMVAYVRDGMALAEDCRVADIVISSVPVRACASAQLVIDLFDLQRGGAHAVWLDGPRLRVESVTAQRGDRPWSLPVE